MTLGFLEKLTLAPDEVGPEDVEPLRTAGVGEGAIVDAIHVCALFNVIDRIADALGFALPEQEYWRRVAPGFLAAGYVDPASPLGAGGPRPGRPGPRRGP